MNNQNSLEEWADWLMGQKVNTLMLYFAVQLLLHGDSDKDCRITIESVFSWTENGSTRVLNPLEPISLCPLLGLLDCKITNAQIEEAGILTLDFETGQRIRAEFDDQYEAWQIADKTTKAQIICLPGGGLG